MMKISLIALTLICGLPLILCLDTTPYTPSESIRRYASFDFEPTFDYGKEVVLKRTVPVVAIGLIVFIALVIWSCCQCCNGEEKPRSTACHTFMIIFSILAVVAGVALIIIGFTADKRQQNAVDDVVGLASDFIDWQNEFAAQAEEIIDIANIMANTTQDILDEGGALINSSVASDVESLSLDSIPGAEEIDNAIAATNFDDIQAQIELYSDTVNQYRHPIVIGVFSVLFALLLFQVGISLLSAYGGDSCDPKNCCCCLTPLISALHIFLILIVWIVAGALLTGSVVMSDVCINVDNIILEESGLSSEPVAEYFVKCDQSDYTQPFPYQSELEEAASAVANISQPLSDLRNSLNCTGFPTAQCDRVDELIGFLEANYTLFLQAVGVNTNGNLNMTTGLAYYTSCSSINGIYQGTLNAVCGSFAGALILTWEVFMAFGVVMLFAEIVHKFLTQSADDDDKITA